MNETQETLRNLLINEVHSALENTLENRGASLDTIVELVTRHLGLAVKNKPSVKERVRKSVGKCVEKGYLKVENGRFFLNKDEYSSSRSTGSGGYGNRRLATKIKRRKRARRVGSRGVDLKDFLRQSLDAKYGPVAYVIPANLPEVRIPKRKSQLTSTEIVTAGVATHNNLEPSIDSCSNSINDVIFEEL